MPPLYIDSHCHLDSPRFDHDRDQVVAQCHHRGVVGWIIPGLHSGQWQRGQELVAEIPGARVALGVHPLCIDQEPDPQPWRVLEQALERNGEVVAIGEVGVDFAAVRAREQRLQQLALFEQQLAVAVKWRLPLLLHVRKGHEEVLALLRQQQPPGGIIHAFSGTPELARRYLEVGFLIGLGGAVTRPNGWRLHKTVRELPLSAFVLETDAPDMPLHGALERRNSPLWIPEIATAVATLRQESLERVAAQTSHQLVNLLGLTGWLQERMMPL